MVWYRIFKRGFLLFFIGLLLNIEGTIPSVVERDDPDYKYHFYFRILGIL